MNPINQGQKGINVDARYRTMLIIWFAILMSVGMIFFVTPIIQPPPDEQGDKTLLWIFAALSVLPFLLSFVLKGRLLAQAVKGQRPELVQSAMILALALCEAVSLFGMMAYLTTGTRYYYIFFIISVVGILLHMPRRNQLLAASYSGQGSGQ
jgi:F0F1-type ATP synthase membrane subunit c/vacuolar-type H+-ATPase subunit K